MVPVRLMLIDDSPEVGTLVRLLTRRAEWSLVISESAEVALDFLANDSAFDLILVDINLPGISGIDLSRRLLSSTWLPLAVFLQSGLHEDLGRAFAAGISHAVYKDYLVHPKRWTARCQEILEFRSGNAPSWLLDYPEQKYSRPCWDGVDQLPLLQALEQGLGKDLARRLAPLLLNAPLDLLPTPLETISSGKHSASVIAQQAFRVLVLCWQLLGTEEIQGLRRALAPLLTSTSQGEPES